MLSHSSCLQKYFENHKEELKKHYPGLGSRVLHQFFEDYCLLNSIDKNSGSYNLKVETFFEGLSQGTPLSYLVGQHFFYENEFWVSPDTLIPRSETEVLVEMAIDEVKNNDFKKVIDIGTGTGAIGLSVACGSQKSLEVMLTDVSENALEVAKSNAWRTRHHYQKRTKISFSLGDRLSNIDETFDLILSNPPYIRTEKDRHLVHDQVLKFEPHLALFIDDSEYQKWFEEFFSQVKKALNPRGCFMMEGHEDHLQGQAKIASSLGLNEAKIVKDLTGRDRFLVCRAE